MLLAAGVAAVNDTGVPFVIRRIVGSCVGGGSNNNNNNGDMGI